MLNNTYPSKSNHCLTQSLSVPGRLKLMSLQSVLLGVTLLIPGMASAASSTIDMTNLLNKQTLFADLVTDLGSALSYKAITPAEPLGVLGIDLGLEFSSTKLNSDAVKTAAGGSGATTLIVPKVHVHKGLPLSLDIGAFVSAVPSSNIKATGLELRYSFVEGNTVLPAIAARGTYSTLSGVDHLELKTSGLELTISKGFAMLTPYAGLGKVKVSGDSDLASLTKETATLNKSYVGLNVNLGLLNIVGETEKTGDDATVSLKFGFRF